MRGQWTDYNNFNLIELIDELKSRIKQPHNIDDMLHGAIIAHKNYYEICKGMRDLIEDDDKIYRLEKEYIKELEKKEIRQTVTFIDKDINYERTLYAALPSCEHELDPNCWSRIKCIKCGGWYCA